MARVHLLSVAQESPNMWPYALDDLKRMQGSAAVDKFGVHEPTDDPAQADVILFVENCNPIQHAFEVRSHPIYQTHGNRCFLFSRDDVPVPFLPGIYASTTRSWYDPTRVRSGFYLDVFDHDFLRYDPDTPRDFLYSFVGHRSNHQLRDQLFELEHENQCLIDTSEYWPYGDLDDETRQSLEEQYVDVACRSQFVLCPRGLGPSSIRLFETMRMGRVPVILSDEWVPPIGPDWDSFSVRIPEANVAQIPALLTARSAQAEAMGRRARQAWDDWFSPEAAFHRTTEWLLDLQEARPTPRQAGLQVLKQLTEPAHLKMFLRQAATYVPSRGLPALS